MKPSGESKVYIDFLTNLAVAWFSAGVIVPLFTPAFGAYKAYTSIVAIVGCLVSLKLAVVFSKKKIL
jgi:hypothetical protein